MSFSRRGVEIEPIEEPTFQKYERAFTTVLNRLKAKISSLRRARDNDIQYRLLQEGLEDVKNAKEYLNTLDREMASWHYHQKANLESRARIRLRSLRKNLSQHQEVLKSYARNLDPDSSVVAPEDRDSRRRLNEMSAIQMDNRSSMERTIREIDDMHSKGTETMEILGGNTEALVRAKSNIEFTSNINSQARNVVNRLAYRVWTDKCLQYSIIGVEIIIIIVILCFKFTNVERH